MPLRWAIAGNGLTLTAPGFGELTNFSVFTDFSQQPGIKLIRLITLLGLPGKKMNEYLLVLIATLISLCSMLFSNLVQAAPFPFEYHADAKMAHSKHGPVDNTYGYLYVESDETGRGTINVMFSNGNEKNWARFNARVKFLNRAGKVIKEERFESWLEAAGFEDAVERRVSKPLEISDFDSIQVDFYLSDISDRYVNAAVDTDQLRQ